jgi:hypothetical protein
VRDHVDKKSRGRRRKNGGQNEESCWKVWAEKYPEKHRLKIAAGKKLMEFFVHSHFCILQCEKKGKSNTISCLSQQFFNGCG